MKLIIAYIKPECLPSVKQSLYENQVFRMSATNALGCGRQKGYHESYRGAELEVNLLKKVRLEIAVNDDFLDTAIEALKSGAQTGEIGDGKIFVMDLVQCIRIRTGETGVEAIG